MNIEKDSEAIDVNEIQLDNIAASPGLTPG